MSGTTNPAARAQAALHEKTPTSEDPSNNKLTNGRVQEAVLAPSIDDYRRLLPGLRGIITGRESNPAATNRASDVLKGALPTTKKPRPWGGGDSMVIDQPLWQKDLIWIDPMGPRKKSSGN